VKVHLVGVAGAGVSALARVYLTRGDDVSGCDIRQLPVTDELQAEGAVITTAGQSAEHVLGMDLVVYGGQTQPDHFELAAARAAGARVRSRAQALADLIAATPNSIAIAGTHGKTTTAFMAGHILNLAGRDTTLYIGDHSTHSRFGRGGWIVAEVDESDGTLLLHRPRHALVTNADYDHANFFSDVDAVRAHFAQWLARLPADGLAVLCADDPFLPTVEIAARKVTYGFAHQADYRIEDARRFRLWRREEELGSVELPQPGRHNRQDAAGAAALCLELGVAFEGVKRGLETFPGAHRRLEFMGEFRGARVYDDYGHHPTEIAAVLDAVREGHPGRAVIVVQPARYSRLRALLPRYVEVLRDVSPLIVTEVYASGEPPNEASGKQLAELVGARYAPDLDSARRQVEEIAEPGDWVVLVGLGDIWKVGRALVD
jgi:UDP-N-acetylmuramate--alanine ligase